MESPNRKVFSVLSYIALLWLVGLLLEKDDPVVKHHVNQGLNLFILEVIGSVLGVIPLIGGLISGLISILCLILAILGIISAAKGEDKPLPILSMVTLIK